jgi:phage gp36-like protein
MSYATPSDMSARYDARRLGDLVGDDGLRVPAANLPANSALQTALDDASGMVDSEIQRGQRYSPIDLSTIMAAAPGDPLYSGRSLLVRLVCDLAYGLLVGRRAYNASDTQAQSPRYAEAVRILDRLGKGELIFPTQGALAAGVPVPGVVLSQNVGLISSLSRIFGYLGVYPGQNQPMRSSFNRDS